MSDATRAETPHATPADVPTPHPGETPPEPPLDAPPASGAAPSPATADPTSTASAPEAVATVPLEALLALVLRAYPEALPDLVTGDSWEALVTSATRAVELRQRIAAELRAADPPVAAGAPRRASEVELGRLSPFEKIARAIAGRGS